MTQALLFTMLLADYCDIMSSLVYNTTGMKYNAKGTYKRHFELFDDKETNLGKLDYANWFSIKAEIALPDGKKYEIAPTSLFQTSVAITADGVQLGKLKFNWKGQIVINLENGQSYIYKRVGFLSSHFGLFNESEHELVTLKQHFQLSTFSFNYTIETDDNYAEGRDAYFVLLLVHCANYFHSMHSGG